MAEVFAGFVAGYVLALVSTPLLAMWLLRLRAESELLGRLFPAGASAVSLGVMLHGMLFFFWTAMGILLGLVLLGMSGGSAAAGSLNAPFSLFVGAMTLMMVAPVAIALPRLRTGALVAAGIVLVVFGWLMPYLASWSNFD